MQIDLRSVSYDNWIAFIFDHPAPYSLHQEEEKPEAWYWESPPDLITSPELQLQYLTQLVQDAGALLRRYTAEQIDQGLWYIFGAGGGRDFFEHLFDPAISWTVRAACIESLPRLWSGLFERQDVGTMSFMLWDSLAYGFYCEVLRPDEDPDHRRIQDAVFAALTGQLAASVSLTQRAALHGLGHLCHPDSGTHIRQFLDNRTITPEIRKYAEDVLAGNFE